MSAYYSINLCLYPCGNLAYGHKYGYKYAPNAIENFQHVADTIHRTCIPGSAAELGELCSVERRLGT
jgi:hypothetical protein